MWENIIQSVKKVKSGDKGLGCILAQYGPWENLSGLCWLKHTYS